MRTLAALAATGALAFGALRWLARRGSSEAPPLKVVARTSLSAKNSLALIEMDGRRYLVAHGDGFAELLSSRKVSAREGGAR